MAAQKHGTKGAPLLVRAERNAALIGAAVGFAFALLLGPQVQILSDQRQWNITELYSVAFNLGAISAGALAAVYALLVSSTTPVIDKLRNNNAFGRFLGFVRMAIALSFLAVIVSIPLIVAKPKILGLDHPSNWIIAVWAGVSLAMIVSFVRVALPVRDLFEVRPASRVRGG